VDGLTYEQGDHQTLTPEYLQEREEIKEISKESESEE
jgi:hypothetical protein